MNRHEITAAFQAQYGFNPRGLFCQFTGKQIGWTDSAEFDDLMNSLSVGNDDVEAVCDDLATRIFASMRPGLHWNKMRSDSLEVMRKTRPVETLAYLLNRLFTPIEGGDMIAVNHDRIRTYRRCVEWGVNDSTNTLVYYLLEVDAKLGLHTEWPTFSLDDVMGGVEMPVLLEMVEAWHERRVAAYELKAKQAEQSSRFWRSGNPLARGAFFSAFMESRPPSKAELAKREKQEERDFFAGLLNEVMGKPNLAGEKKAPVPEIRRINLPNTKMPLRFGRKQVEG